MFHFPCQRAGLVSPYPNTNLFSTLPPSSIICILFTFSTRHNNHLLFPPQSEKLDNCFAMPRQTKNSGEQGYGGLPSGLPPSMYPQPRMMPESYYVPPPSSSAMPIPSPLQTSQQSQYGPYSTSAPSPTLPMVSSQPSQHRPSSGAWSQQDDQQLLTARMQGLNWNQIKEQYFPLKTPNACRKRHERLMERRGSDDWDARKMQILAKEYMSMRKEIWSGLAARTGEKWNVVEAKVSLRATLLFDPLFSSSFMPPTCVIRRHSSGPFFVLVTIPFFLFNYHQPLLTMCVLLSSSACPTASRTSKAQPVPLRAVTVSRREHSQGMTTIAAFPASA